MELFKLSAPDYAPDGCESLYYRVMKGNITINNNKYKLSNDAIVSTDTYFNIFSSSKYSEYTNAENIVFTTTVSGKMNICLHVCTEEKDEIIEQVPVCSDAPQNISISFNINGLSDRTSITCHYVTFESDGPSTIHEWGSYSSDIQSKDVRLAVVICTFRREPFVKKTVEALENIISHQSYDTNDIDVYVIDNGQTLSDNLFSSPYVHLIPNRNLGGSGGFTRGMIEAVENNATHILLMDDDIVLDPNTVHKTLNLLKILKDEHKDAFILGGMLDLNEPTEQFEAGSLYNGRFIRCKGDLDLLSSESLLHNDLFEKADYGGWWYACIPAHICENNLPLPLFVKMDDVEYSLRNMNDHIIMNGLGVWHENFSNKLKRVGEDYYLERNSMIIRSVSELDDSFTHYFWHKVLYLISVSEQTSLDLYLHGISDYLRGADFLLDLNEEEYHLQLQKMDTDEGTYRMKAGRSRTLVKLAFTRRFWKNIACSSKVYFRFMRNRKRVSREYRDHLEELTDTEMWKRRLNI